MATLDRFRLDGKVAVVTGASRNIGLEICRAFAEAGATVVMAARRRQALEAAGEAIAQTTGARVETIVADIGDTRSVDHLIQATGALFDRVDILVNNAGATGATEAVPILEESDEAWEATFAVNVLGPYRLCRGFGPGMLRGGGGSIINVLSPSGFVPTPRMAPYGASKAALWMMTRYLAAECAPAIRVNGLAPGMVRNDTASWAAGGDIGSRLVALTPMGRMGDPTEVAPAALYLASDASSYTTGAVIMVNGGRPW